MFGTKQAKRTGLQKLATLVEQSPHGITQAELARDLRAARSTIMCDLVALEEHGILFAEDARGKLTLFGRWSSKRSK